MVTGKLSEVLISAVEKVADVDICDRETKDKRVAITR
jgi:hypothetical protein